MRKFPMIAAVAAMTAASVAPTAAEAHGRNQRYSQQQRYYDQGYANRGYDNRYYGQTRQRCRSGTTGAIVGAAAGALLGREIIGRGDRTLGTILGGAAGGLGGRALTRDKYCR